MTGSDVLVDALVRHGVDVVFGIPGTHNLGVFAALESRGVRTVLTRHEQGATYAADGYARSSGRPGVVVTTTGPALLNTAAAVGQAYSDGVPLLVISPGMPTDHPQLPSGLLHESRSQQQAMRNIAAFSHRAATVAEIPVGVARAFSSFASGRPRPAHLEVPLDLFDAPADDVRPVTAPPLGVTTPAPAEVARAAAALASAGRSALVLGGGARGAADQCRQLAERLGIPVVTTANGKGVVDEEHVLSLGVALHSPAVQHWLTTCDVVVAVGTELAEADFWCAPPRIGGVLVRIDVDAAQHFAGQPSDVALVADAATALGLLLEEVGDGTAGAEVADRVRGLREQRDAGTSDRDATWTAYLAALRDVLPATAVVTSDSAQCCYYGALPHLPVGPAGRYLHPTGFGTLGFALPAAIGAVVADPDRPALALCGDGGFQFTVQELATAVELGIPLPVVVFDNGGYGEIREEMLARGDRAVCVDLAAGDPARISEAYGGAGVHVGTPAQLARAVQDALGRPGPTVIVVPEKR